MELTKPWSMLEAVRLILGKAGNKVRLSSSRREAKDNGVERGWAMDRQKEISNRMHVGKGWLRG